MIAIAATTNIHAHTRTAVRTVTPVRPTKIINISFLEVRETAGKQSCSLAYELTQTSSEQRLTNLIRLYNRQREKTIGGGKRNGGLCRVIYLQ